MLLNQICLLPKYLVHHFCHLCQIQAHFAHTLLLFISIENIPLNDSPRKQKKQQIILPPPLSQKIQKNSYVLNLPLIKLSRIQQIPNPFLHLMLLPLQQLFKVHIHIVPEQTELPNMTLVLIILMVFHGYMRYLFLKLSVKDLVYLPYYPVFAHPFRTVKPVLEFDVTHQPFVFLTPFLL